MRAHRLAMAVLLVIAPLVRAEDKASSDITPAVAAAINELSSDSFKAREKAVADLRLAIGEQLRALAQSTDPEAKKQVIAAVEFDAGLTRWAIDTLQLPAEERKKAVAFAMRPEVQGVLAKTFSPQFSQRMAGIKALAKFDEPDATALLARLIDDRDQKVCAAAIEAVGDRKPTDQVVDALWNRAMGPSVFWANPMVAVIQGRQGQIEWQLMNQAEGELACDVLIKLKTERVKGRIVDAMKAVEEIYTKSPQGTVPWMINSTTSAKSFFKLLQAEKPREAYAAIYRIIHAPLGQVMNAGGGQNGFYTTSRTLYIAEFLKLAGEKPTEHKLKSGKLGPGSWSFATEAEEAGAVKWIEEWWSKHSAEYEELPTTAPSEVKQGA